MESAIKITITTLGGVISWMVGGWGLLLTVLLVFNALDFLTGMAASWGTISSKRGFQGIIKNGLWLQI